MDELIVASHDHIPLVPMPPPPRPGLAAWFLDGLRSAILLRPGVTGEPAPTQFIALLLPALLVELLLARLEIDGAARFSVSGWLTPFWSVAVTLLLGWILLRNLRPDTAGGRPSGVAAWYALSYVGSLPAIALIGAMAVLRAREALPAVLDTGPLAWAVYFAICAWFAAVPVALAWHFGAGRAKLAVLAAALVATQWVGSTYFYERSWYPERLPGDEGPRLSLSQESFETQQAVWKKAVDSLAPQRAAVRDVYGLVFAPYASEDVFLRESTMVAEVLAQRFDAQGRVLHLANHASTGDRLPWATPLNLKRAIEALGKRMDPEQDVLVVYLTSHGARDFKLSAAHWPLKVDGIGPAELRQALDDAGIRHRVIAISACFSGGWVAPLASDTSLVMTAADADHTSYGCGRLSELTYFGRALFDEQLRGTHSFEQAFHAAVPVIRQREVEANKPDGFSNPQISAGAKIRPVLEEVAARLDGPMRP